MHIMKINYKHMGKIIKKKRKDKHITQKELSSIINKSVTHISKIEQGTTKASLQTIIDIADALNTSVDEILQNNVMKTAKIKLIEEYEDIFRGCNFEEQRFLIENLKFTKYQLKDMQNSFK